MHYHTSSVEYFEYLSAFLLRISFKEPKILMKLSRATLTSLTVVNALILACLLISLINDNYPK